MRLALIRSVKFILAFFDSGHSATDSKNSKNIPSVHQNRSDADRERDRQIQTERGRVVERSGNQGHTRRLPQVLPHPRGVMPCHEIAMHSGGRARAKGDGINYCVRGFLPPGLARIRFPLIPDN